jgi:hypothetical protein
MTKKRNAEAIRVIKALGGTGATAALFDIHAASVSGWKVHGIPKARKQFLQLLRPDLFPVVKKK